MKLARIGSLEFGLFDCEQTALTKAAVLQVILVSGGPGVQPRFGPHFSAQSAVVVLCAIQRFIPGMCPNCFQDSISF